MYIKIKIDTRDAEISKDILMHPRSIDSANQPCYRSGDARLFDILSPYFAASQPSLATSCNCLL